VKKINIFLYKIHYVVLKFTLELGFKKLPKNNVYKTAYAVYIEDARMSV